VQTQRRYANASILVQDFSALQLSLRRIVAEQGLDRCRPDAVVVRLERTLVRICLSEAGQQLRSHRLGVFTPTRLRIGVLQLLQH